MPKSCHHCGKEIGDPIPFKCRRCNEIFCIDHFLPENHKCHDLSRKKRVEQEPTKILEETEQDIDSRPIPKTVIISKKPKEKKNNTIVKISIILAIIIILLNVISVSGYFILDQSYSELKEEKHGLEDKLTTTQNTLDNANHTLALTEMGLEQVNTSLKENNSEVQQLESGDKYNLRDPLYSEVTRFIQNDNSDNEKTLIDNAKSKGLRCALVEVGIIGSTIKILGAPRTGESYLLMAFNTTDKGMVYFESKTDYRVYPEIGKSYIECVEGNPYISSLLVNDTITKILVVW